MFLFLMSFSLVIEIAFSANILVLGIVESYSHHIWIETLVEALLENGHNITLIGHQDTKIKRENYTVYKISGFDEIIDDIDLASQHHTSIFTNMMVIWHYFMLASKIHLKSHALKLMLRYPRDEFDLIMLDVTCGQEFYPLIEHFGNPPIIGVAPFILPPYILDTMGSHFYFYYPHFLVSYTDDMTFFQRLANTLLYITEYFQKWNCVASIYKMSQEVYGEDIASFDLIERKIGLLLANYDPILDIAVPLPPNIIPVGGMHVKRPEKLPHDILEILDKAKDGVIYFSFGTIVEGAWLSADAKTIFLNVFSKLNQTVLWKYSGDDLKNIPKNVIIRKWWPQNDILAHENIKLLINHGGILSTHETMYHGVPILGIPFFADQNTNTAKMAARNVGRKLYIKDLTEESLCEMILEVINNPIYKQNMQKISQTFRNQKETPLERAVFWTEYALRNKDLSHLSTKARDMTLLQRENLDVYGVILFFIITVFVVFLAIIKCIVTSLVLVKEDKVKQN